MAKGRKTIPNRLWKYRTRLGFHQTEIALRLGVKNTSMISRWERGLSMPSAENLLKLSKLYKTTANELYYELGLEFNKQLFPQDYLKTH